MRIFKIVLFLSLILVIQAPIPPASAATYVVPIDYPDLHTAINNVLPGDRIYVDVDQNINTPILISGKSYIDIIFRYGSRVVTQPGFMGTEIIRITTSNNISIYSLDIQYRNTVFNVMISGVMLDRSSNITIDGIVFNVDPAVPAGTFYRVVWINDLSKNISVYNIEMVNQIIPSPQVVGVLISYPTLSQNSKIRIYNVTMENIQLVPPGSGLIAGVFGNIVWYSSLEFEARNISISGSVAGRLMGVSIGGNSVLDYSEVVISDIYGSNLVGDAYLVTLNWMRFTSYVNRTNVTVRDIYGYNWQLSRGGVGVWIYFNHFRLTDIDVENVDIKNVQGPSIGIVLNMGSPVISPGAPYIPPDGRSKLYLNVSRIDIANLRSSSMSVGLYITLFGSTPRVQDSSVYLWNVNVSNTSTGMLLHMWFVERYRFWAEYYRYNNRTGLGLQLVTRNMLTDMHPVSTPSSLADLRLSEDLYFAYSILWRIQVLSGSSHGITLFESVVDELNSQIVGPISVRSVWTLETFVYSSITSLPIPGIYVEYLYPAPSQYSFGYTDSSGRYAYIMDYYMTNPPVVQVGLIQVAVSSGYYSASVMLPTYISVKEGIPLTESHYTLPAWFGEVVFTLPLVSLKAMGFSHDMGTTYLFIAGTVGWYAGYYSYTPDELWSGGLSIPSANNTWAKSPFRNYQLRGLRVSWTGTVVQIRGEIFYDGYWQPVTIYIDPERRVVWSPGPVDFRGWF